MKLWGKLKQKKSAQWTEIYETGHNDTAEQAGVVLDTGLSWCVVSTFEQPHSSDDGRPSCYAKFAP
jgi:hypothetical protein